MKKRKEGLRIFGIIIAILVGLFQYVFTAKAPEAIWLISTRFLFWWYMAWTPVIVLIIVFVTKVIAITVTFYESIGDVDNMLLKGMNRFIKNKNLSILWFSISSGLKIGGAYLLSTVVVTTLNFTLNNTILIGSLFLIIGNLMTNKFFSSSSKS